MPNTLKKGIIKRREEIKNKLSELIKKNKLGLSFADIEKMIFEESGGKEFNEIVALFFKDFHSSNINEMNELMQAVSDAWNYFPHQILGGLSPSEKAATKVVSEKFSKKNDLDELWGEDGPYSEVKFIEETRILDDRISRVFMVVEAVINPFTFKLCLKNKKHFKDDEMILQLLEHSDSRGFEYGYVSMAFCEELAGEETFKKAVVHKQYAETAIIRMHKFVMKELGIPESPAFKMKIR
jgi:hypothetical protein